MSDYMNVSFSPLISPAKTEILSPLGEFKSNTQNIPQLWKEGTHEMITSNFPTEQWNSTFKGNQVSQFHNYIITPPGYPVESIIVTPPETKLRSIKHELQLEQENDQMVTSPIPVPTQVSKTTNETDENSDKKIYIAEGFLTTPESKQLGGRDNKEALPRHVIKVNLHLLGSKISHNKLRVKALLYGYKRLTDEKILLDSLGELPLRQHNHEFVCVFDKLVVKHSSHNHGQRLFVRFVLYNPSLKQEIAYCDSAGFETITRRGIEKQRQKQNVMRHREETEVPREPEALQVEPRVGVPGQIVKIFGRYFEDVPVQKIFILFGNCRVRDVYCVRPNMIVCEVPFGFIGEAHVRVSFTGGKEFTNTQAKFFCIDPQNNTHLHHYTIYLRDSFLQIAPHMNTIMSNQIQMNHFQRTQYNEDKTQ